MKKKINIFGSCCTRELFNYQEQYEVGIYVMHQSLFTLYSKPLEITYDQTKSTDGSKFKRRMIYYEFNKLGLSKVLEEPSDFLVVDFADCRYDIYDFDNPKGVKIIYTHESRATFGNIKELDQFKNIEMHYCNVMEEFSDDMIREILIRFTRQILSVYDAEHIVLNKIQMNDEYFENGEQKKLENNFHYNRRQFIKKIEDMFLELVPNCKVLETDEKPILNINHKFGGPHPMHYEDIYYEYRMNCLKNIFSSQNNIFEIKQNYKKMVERNIENIKNKKHDENNNCNSTARVD